MRQNLYIILFMLTGIVHVIYSENGNLLPMLIFNESSQTSNLDPSTQYTLDTKTKEPLENKNLNKRQTLNMNADDDINSQGSVDYIKNFSTGAKVRTFERQNEKYNWGDEKGRPFDQEINYFGRNENFGFGQNYQAHTDSKSKFGWGKKEQGSQSTLNSERMFQQYALNDFSNERNSRNSTDSTKDSTTSMSEHYATKKHENSNNKLLINMYSSPVYSSPRYQSTNERFNLNQYENDKGLVINFNKECPTPSHTNNRFVYKYILMPNSLFVSQIETTPFQISDAAVISSARMTNPIYCY